MDFLDDVDDTVRAHLFTKESELPNGVLRPPLKTIRLNKAPVVLSTEWVAGPVAERLGLDGDKARRSLAALRGARDADPDAFKRFIQSIFSERQFEARTDPDVMLYEGFIDREDEHHFEDIRGASPEQLRDTRWGFKDTRLPELLFRYRARNYPESLRPEEHSEWLEHCHAKLTADSQDKELPFWEALAEELARPGLSTRQRDALDDLERYARARLGKGDSNGQNPT
jgi:exodeoxyribonuclease-1